MKKIKRINKEATILSILGGIGLIATAVLTAKDTPKAIELLAEAKKEKGEELTVPEKVVTATKAYVPALAIGASSLLCIFGANVLNKKTQVSLMSAYSMAGNMYRDYRKKNIEMFGEENDKQIIEELQRVNAEYHQIGISTPDAKVRWYEPNSDTFFEAYEREILDAEYHINRNYVIGNEMSINNVNSFFGIGPIAGGDDKGWYSYSGMYWIDFEHRMKNDSEGVYYVIDTLWPPEEYDESCGG